MHHSLIAILTFVLSSLLSAISAYAQSPPPVAGQVQVQPADARTETARLMVPHLRPSLALDKESAGLPRGSEPELLTWDRVYPLALVRARRPQGTAKGALDLKVLEEESVRHGVADFARFRQEFLAPADAAGNRLRDPSADFLDLLQRLLTIDNARRNVAFYENLKKLVQELVQTESSGLCRVDLDAVFLKSIHAGQRLVNEIAQYRDRLDVLKTRLGLSPHAAVVPSRTSVGAFEADYRKVEDWVKRPDRSLTNLYRLIDQFPIAGDVFVDGRPLLSRIDEAPDSMEAVLMEVLQLAVKHSVDSGKASARGEDAVDRELNIRRRFRHVYETHRAYDNARFNYQMAIRLADQSFERLCSPTSGIAASRSPAVNALLKSVDELQRSADRLVSLWTTFRANRLALYRELGVLPYNDWSSFYAQFSAGPAGGQEAPPEPPANAIAPAVGPPAEE
jgi:hypothetical protein